MALILSYHRVAEAQADPWSLVVTPDRFSQHMEVLRGRAYPCTLAQLLRDLSLGQPRRNAVAVTFDDGYADNLSNAKPILERYDVPATIFVCSGGIGLPDEFWWDQLERACLAPCRTVPSTLEISVAGQHWVWRLEDEACLAGNDNSDRPSTCLASFPAPRRFDMFQAVWQALRPLPPAMQAEAMRQVTAWAAISDEARPAYRRLELRELRALAASPLIEIGAHTVSHPLLTAHSCEFQRQEILESKRQLEEMIERPVARFAYPFGAHDETTVRIVEEAGFASGCTTRDGLATPLSSPYELPRVTIHDWNADQFWQVLQGKMAGDLDVGQRTSVPFLAFKSKTGELGNRGVECSPGKHLPGYCLFGADIELCQAGVYRATFTIEQEAGVEPEDVVLDVYENRRFKRVLAETNPRQANSEDSRANASHLEFYADPGDRVECRVYWRGRRELRVTGVSCERLN